MLIRGALLVALVAVVVYALSWVLSRRERREAVSVARRVAVSVSVGAVVALAIVVLERI